MPLQQKIIAVGIAFGIFVIIIELIRRRKLRVEYSWMWLVTGTSILLLSFNYDFLIYLTKLIGANIPLSTLFFGAIIFLIFLCLQFSIRISSLTDKVNILTQELTIIKETIDKSE